MAEAATAHAGTDWVSLLVDYWWVWLLFGGGILEWVGETFNVGVSALRRRAKARRQHQLKLKRLELQIAQAKTAPSQELAVIPGPCRHRKAVPVRSNDGDVLAWLCKSCDTQLPADFSIYAEDL